MYLWRRSGLISDMCTVVISLVHTRRALVVLTLVVSTLMGLLASQATAHTVDRDCADFGFQAAAQDHRDVHAGDPDNLDHDEDGRACEELPCPCDWERVAPPDHVPAAPARSAPSGPLFAAQPATSTTRLRFTPRVKLRRRALRRGPALGLGSISCSDRCVAHVTLRHGRRVVTSRVVVADDHRAVELQSGAFSPRATRVRVSVRFDDHPATARGAVKLR